MDPYTVSNASISKAEELSEDEKVREAHISREATLKTLSIINYISALIFGFVGLSTIVEGFHYQIGFILLGIAIFFIWMGWGLWFFNQGVQLVATFIAFVLLFIFPIGTLIGVYGFWILLSKKSRTVFADEYKDLVRLTPNVKYKPTPWLFILLFLILISSFLYFYNI